MTTENETIPTQENPKIVSGAGYLIRLGARLIDLAYVSVLGFIAGIVGGLIVIFLEHSGLATPHADWGERLQRHGILMNLSSVCATVLYHTTCEAVHGSTLGKLICRIRVIQINGKPSNLKGAFIRSISFLIDQLIFGAVGYSSMSKTPLNLRYGDKWGKTLVVRSKEVAHRHPRGPINFIAGFLLGSTIWVITLAATVIYIAFMPGG